MTKGKNVGSTCQCSERVEEIVGPLEKLKRAVAQECDVDVITCIK
jgi:hypothetical protein